MCGHGPRQTDLVPADPLGVAVGAGVLQPVRLYHQHHLVRPLVLRHGLQSFAEAGHRLADGVVQGRPGRRHAGLLGERLHVDQGNPVQHHLHQVVEHGQGDVSLSGDRYPTVHPAALDAASRMAPPGPQ